MEDAIATSPSHPMHLAHVQCILHVCVCVYDCMRVSFFLVSSCCMEVKVAVARTVFSICFFKASTGHTTVWYAGTAASSVQHMLQYTHTCMHVHMQYPVCIYVCMQYVKLTRQTPSNGAFSSLLSLPHSLHATLRGSLSNCGHSCFALFRCCCGRSLVRVVFVVVVVGLIGRSSFPSSLFYCCCCLCVIETCFINCLIVIAICCCCTLHKRALD